MHEDEHPDYVRESKKVLFGIIFIIFTVAVLTFLVSLISDDFSIRFD